MEYPATMKLVKVVLGLAVTAGLVTATAAEAIAPDVAAAVGAGIVLALAVIRIVRKIGERNNPVGRPDGKEGRADVRTMAGLAAIGLVLICGCALPLSVNQHLDALESGINIAQANAIEAHGTIEAGLAAQRAAGFDAARADLARIATTQPKRTVPIGTSLLVIDQLRKQGEALDLLARAATRDRATAMDNFAALRRMLGEAKGLVVSSQGLSQELRNYIGYLEASRAAARLVATTQVATEGQ